jgi:hypothetical protein
MTQRAQATPATTTFWARAALGFAVATGALSYLACGSEGTTTGSTSSSSGTSTGTGGAGGMCPTMPVALFTLHVTSAAGALPADTTVEVMWSAGTEPTFHLDDKSTWKTLSNANLVCDVDPEKPAPTDLQELVCHLWTSGATEVQVYAKGYTPYDKTSSPKLSEKCQAPIPSDILVELAPAADGG